MPLTQPPSRLQLARILGLSVLLSALTACAGGALGKSPNTSTPSISHQAYQFRADMSQLTDRDIHIGDAVPILWQALPARLTTEPAIPVTLTVSLIGPVASKEDATSRIEAGQPPVLSVSVLATDQTGVIDPRSLVISPATPPGNYALVQTIEMPGNRLQAVGTITIVK